MTRIEIALGIVIAVVAIVTTIGLWKLDERVLRLEALVSCLEREAKALRRKIADMRNGGTDNA